VIKIIIPWVERPTQMRIGLPIKSFNFDRAGKPLAKG